MIEFRRRHYAQQCRGNQSFWLRKRDTDQPSQTVLMKPRITRVSAQLRKTSRSNGRAGKSLPET